MSQDAPSRRSQRSNRKLPARYLDDNVEVTTCQQRKSPSPHRRNSQGKKHVSASESSNTVFPNNAHNIAPQKTKDVSKRVPKVKCKTDITHGFDVSTNKDLSEDGILKVHNKKKLKFNTQDGIHATEDEMLLNEKATKESRQCEICKRTFSRASSLRRHVQAASCGKRLAIEAELMEENVGNEEQEHDGKPGKKRLVCKICRKTFVDKYTLIVHRRTHTGERPYHCTLCDKKFTQRSTLQFHVDTHSGQKHECTICGYKFTQARSLKRHMIFHSGDKEMKRKLVNTEFEKVRVEVENPEGDAGEFYDDGRVYMDMYQCEFCKKHFKKVAELRVHLRVHTNERPYVCLTCGKTFKQLSHLNGHQVTHENSELFTCEDCGTKFTQAKSLQRHLSSKLRSDGKVQCRKRGRPRKIDEMEQELDEENVQSEGEECFAEESTAVRVLENITEGTEDIEPSQDASKSHGSSPTDKGFTCTSNFMPHRNTHTAKKDFNCTLCEKKFTTLNYLKSHMKVHSQEKPYSCDNCNKRFKSAQCLQNHAGRNCCTGIRPYKCETCGKSFMYERYLKTHRCHNTPVKLYSCGDCGKMYERRDRLIEHMRSHTGERPFTCTLCNKTFAKIANFRLHQRVHTGEKRYECSQCGKRFAHNSTLRYHETTHKKDKAFPCDQCDKQFPRKKALQTHKVVAHVDGLPGETSYLCANCGKAYHHLKRLLKHHCEATSGKRFLCGVCLKHFDREKQLEIHMRTHTGEKPFECDKCGKRFTQSGGLKDHMLGHTREKKFQCDLCGVKFLRMKSLRKHKLIIHTGVEPQVCKVCGATFKYYKALKKHEVTHEAQPKTFTDILEDIEQAINNASTEMDQSNPPAVIRVVDGVDEMDQVAEVVVQEAEEPCQEIIITDQSVDGQVLHMIQDPEQLEIEQSINEIQIQAQLEEEERAHQVLMAVVASVDHHEEVVSAPEEAIN